MKQKVKRAFLWDYALCMTVYNMGVGTVMAKLAAYYGLSLSVSNLIIGLPGTLMFTELLGGYFYGRSAHPHRYIKTVSVLWRFSFPCVLLAVLLPHNAAVVVTVFFYIAVCLFYRLAMPAYNAWTVAGVAKCGDAGFYSQRDLVFMPFYTVVLFLSGILVDRAEQVGRIKTGFLLVAALEVVFVAISLVFLVQPPAPACVKEANRLSFFASLARPLADKAYRMVLLMNIVWNFFAAFVGGFAAVYQVQVLTVSYFDIVFWGMVANIVRIFLIPVFSKLSDKIGWNNATLISMGMMLLAYLSWIPLCEANQSWMFPLVTILGAAPWAALGIGMFKYQILYTNEENRSSYFSVSSALSGVAAAGGNMACSALVAVLSASFAAPPFWTIFVVGASGVGLALWVVKRTPYHEP